VFLGFFFYAKGAEAMSKSELKRQCAQNPMEMAERIAELEQRVKVLQDGLRKLLIGEDFSIGYNEGNHIAELLNQTPQQTAEQIERWHVEWMMKLPTFGVWHQGETDKESDFFLGDAVDAADCSHCTRLVAIPPLPKESKE
jgi:hypothetical protein